MDSVVAKPLLLPLLVAMAAGLKIAANGIKRHNQMFYCSDPTAKVGITQIRIKDQKSHNNSEDR